MPSLIAEWRSVQPSPRGVPGGRMTVPVVARACNMILGKQGAKLEKKAGWGLAIVVAVFSVYMYWAKPTCRDGFTPLTSFGTGWYCRPGYKPE
jgi:hypothetical protein